MSDQRQILVTGAAGFIGYHTAQRLMDRGDQVLGVDNLNAYYDVRLKESRLSELCRQSQFEFVRLDIGDRQGMERLFDTHAVHAVVHLAAQAGVRYSLVNPHAYVESNLSGF